MPGYEMMTVDDTNYQITINHLCGHKQVFPKRKMFMQRGVEHFGPGFADLIFGWLGDKPCPDCYNKQNPISIT